MQSEKLSFVFFGSGPVAARSLALLRKEFAIEAVVTKSTTKQEMAQVAQDVPVFTTDSKQELDDLFTAQKFQSPVGVLIDFGIIVSTKIIDYFEHGIVNSHFSLLPKLRGADPISFAILQGHAETGVSLMLLVQAMDEGPIIAQDRLDVHDSDTTLTLTNNLIRLSFDMLKRDLNEYVSGKLPVKQQSGTPSYTRKLIKADGVIDWNKAAQQIEREIRAFVDWPKSRTTLGSIDVIITKAHAVPSSFGKPGDLKALKEGSLMVQAADGCISIEKLKPAGKQEMNAKAFLAGYASRLDI